MLPAIRQRPRHFYNIARMAGKLKSTADQLVAAAGYLQEAGYRIKLQKKERLAFISAPDLLLAAEIKRGLKTRFIGKTVYSFRSVQSTNTIASRLADIHAVKGTLPAGPVPEGTIVVSESQTRGRGRLGRRWHSPPGTGIYVSIILYPQIEPARAPGLSLMTAISLADTFHSLDQLQVRIKWPNDCLINGRKVAGILTELSAEIGDLHHVIVGVGINANQKRGEFPGAVAKTATSVRAELKKEISRVELLQKFLKNFENDYMLFRKSGLKPLRKRILACSSLIGQNIKLERRGITISGKATDIDEDGNLVLETDQGLQRFNSGEVTVAKR